MTILPSEPLSLVGRARGTKSTSSKLAMVPRRQRHGAGLVLLLLLSVRLQHQSGGRADATTAPSVFSSSLRRAESNQQSSHNGRSLHHTHGNPIEQTNIRAYKLWQPQEIRETVLKWAEHYPKLITVTTSQEAYGLPTAGSDEDCPFETENVGCLNYILTLQDFEAHPEGSESSNRLPEILWSGELHGNERVGPTAVLEAVDLLLQAAMCEALPRIALKQAQGTEDYEDSTAWRQELEKAHSCREDLADQGVDDAHRRWLARLLTTRRIVVVPTANALGYFQNRREENGIDPNRDFPYDLKTASMCMQTIAGRTLNEVFRQHMFQLSLTFHGGMEVVGYEWGAPHWQPDDRNDPNKRSPDDTAQSEIAAAYSKYAGGWSTTKPYAYGPMNDLVYPVHGGMEDWAYAGSWDPDRVIQCQPGTYNGYDAEKTAYDESTLRVFNMLVETSNSKEPKHDLGTSKDILITNSDSNGHVARNIRLALLAAELVQPYAAVHAVNELELTDDLVPLVDRTKHACRDTKTVAVLHNSRKAVVQWTVGGALTVDATSLVYASWGDLDDYDCDAQPSEDVVALLQEGTSIGTTSGTTAFGGTATTFSASLDISGFQAGDTIAVFAKARVDQDWAGLLETAIPQQPPQSHVVNARTNPDWYHKKDDGKIIQGRLDWYSVPVTIVLMEYEDGQVEAEELSMRYDEAQIEHDKEQKEKEAAANYGNTDETKEVESVIDWTLVMFCLVIVCIVGYAVGKTYLYVTMRKSRREMVREFIEDGSAVTPGLKPVANTGGKNGPSRKPGDYSDLETDDGEVELGRYSDHGLT